MGKAGLVKYCQLGSTVRAGSFEQRGKRGRVPRRRGYRSGGQGWSMLGSCIACTMICCTVTLPSPRKRQVGG